MLDAQGCSTAFIYTGQSTTCPGGASATTTAALDTLPVLSRFRVTRGARAFRYRLNERARVKIAIARKKGRRFKRVGALKARGHNGRNRTKFSGKLRGRG